MGLWCPRRGHGNPCKDHIQQSTWNSLQCSCLENPRDGGAWWAAVYGVTQSRTRLKRLHSSSIHMDLMATEDNVTINLRISLDTSYDLRPCKIHKQVHCSKGCVCVCVFFSQDFLDTKLSPTNRLPLIPTTCSADLLFLCSCFFFSSHFTDELPFRKQLDLFRSRERQMRKCGKLVEVFIRPSMKRT